MARWLPQAGYDPTGFSSAEDLLRSFPRLASGCIIAFLEKPVRYIELLAAAIRGQAQLSGNTEPIPDPQIARRLGELTKRERQVLGCILQRKLNKQMAAMLGVAERTVKGYRAP